MMKVMSDAVIAPNSNIGETRNVSPENSALVTLVIAVQNCLPYLDECFKGILDQVSFIHEHGKGSVEVSIYDDASTDGSFEYCRDTWASQFEEQGFKFILSGAKDRECAGGAAHARNCAIAQSTGVYLCIQDADDVSLPNRLITLYNYAKDFKEHTLIGSRFERKPKGSTHRYTDWCNTLSPERLVLEQYREVTLIQPTWFLRRSLFEKLGGYQVVEDPPIERMRTMPLVESNRQRKKRLRMMQKQASMNREQSTSVEHSSGENSKKTEIHEPSHKLIGVDSTSEIARELLKKKSTQSTDDNIPTGECAGNGDKVLNTNRSKTVDVGSTTNPSAKKDSDAVQSVSVSILGTSDKAGDLTKTEEKELGIQHKIALAEDLRLFHKFLDLPDAFMFRAPETLVMYRHRGGSLCSQTPRRLLLRIRVRAFERRVLSMPNWEQFSIWGAGRDGKAFYNELRDEFKLRVRCFADIDSKKIERGQFCALRKTQMPVVHFSNLTAPLVICVALNRTDGELESNVKKLGLVEGTDYFHFI